MRFFRTKFFAGIIAILLLSGLGYYLFLNRPQPCQKPITYSIVNLDPRFNLTKEEFLTDIKQAEKIWESPIDKELFQYSPAGDLKISLIYDYRQKATDAMRKIGIVINDDKSTYDALKARYDLLIASYNKEKAQIRTRKDVDSLNKLVDTINSTETILNKLVATLNLNVSAYNAVGSSTGREYKEGEYVSGAKGTEINIFQFDNSHQLLRVLAHELGHALGLEHLSNPKAIMYYLNEGMNEKLTADDLTALKKRCGITTKAGL